MAFVVHVNALRKKGRPAFDWDASQGVEDTFPERAIKGPKMRFDLVHQCHRVGN